MFGGPSEAHSLGVITKDFKYIFWNYGANGFEPTEEIFHISKDRLELKNEIENPEYKKSLNEMRKHYDQAVSKWKNEAVKFNDYERFATIFDRNTSWSEKSHLVKGAKSVESKKKKKKK